MDKDFTGGYANHDTWVDKSKFNLTFPFEELGVIEDSYYNSIL